MIPVHDPWFRLFALTKCMPSIPSRPQYAGLTGSLNAIPCLSDLHYPQTGFELLNRVTFQLIWPIELLGAWSDAEVFGSHPSLDTTFLLQQDWKYLCPALLPCSKHLCKHRSPFIVFRDYSLPTCNSLSPCPCLHSCFQHSPLQLLLVSKNATRLAPLLQ